MVTVDLTDEERIALGDCEGYGSSNASRHDGEMRSGGPRLRRMARLQARRVHCDRWRAGVNIDLTEHERTALIKLAHR